MDARDQIKIARAELADALDIKFANDPIWKAFRAMDRALESFDHAKPRSASFKLDSGKTIGLIPTYTTLARQAIIEADRPITTPELMDYIGRHRKLAAPPEKAKINVTSSLSKDEKFESIPWEGGRAWWLKGRDLPSKAASLLSKLGSNLREEGP